VKATETMTLLNRSRMAVFNQSRVSKLALSKRDSYGVIGDSHLLCLSGIPETHPFLSLSGLVSKLVSLIWQGAVLRKLGTVTASVDWEQDASRRHAGGCESNAPVCDSPQFLLHGILYPSDWGESLPQLDGDRKSDRGLKRIAHEGFGCVTVGPLKKSESWRCSNQVTGNASTIHDRRRKEP